ncbi:TPA: Dot/Icm T4SS effector Lem21, partial [Legionella pneumophila]|nr:Dot/Icm T4SS effector Lem21 [Legionella pneumophila]
ELKGMTDALAISLVENREEDITDNRIKIRLENQEEHWNVLCNEEDSERFLDSTPSRLKMTSLEAYRGDKQVSAPTSEQLDLIEEPGVFLRERTIDNPGLGNCAFYAFAIGLVNIIQEEAKYNRRTMFDRWVGLDRSISGQYDEILKLNLEDPDKELLDRLQSSLRIVTYQYQIRELRNVCVFRNGNYNRLTGNSNFVNFAALYYGDPLDTDSRFNPFADSVPILMKMANIDRDSVHPGHENDVLVPLFLDLLYGDTTNPADITLETEPKSDSPIITAMNNITQDFFWGTHLDLNYLAEAFEVNLHVLRNNSPIQEFVDIPERHTLTLTNSNNTHWTTQITTARATTGMLLGRNPHLSGAKRIGEQQRVNEGFPGKESANDFMIPPFDEISNPHHKKEVETNKPIGKGFFHDRPVVSEEQRKLEQLKRIVANATLAYTTYSESIWFCFFHYHGQTGRDRANNFCKTFSKITDYGQAKEALVHYLNDSRNGNTHPHSYRTMLLHELQGNHDNKKDLQYLSRHFTSSLNKLASVLEVQLFANRYVP